jgi:RNA polymerase sigma factor (TIGR02999 family)
MEREMAAAESNARSDRSPEVTLALRSASGGDRSKLAAIMPLVYDELKAIGRRLMAAENASHTLQTTALVNEAYFRLCDARNLDATSRNEFFAIAANVMRRVLIDHARTKKRDKRGGGMRKLTMSGVDVATEENTLDMIALDEALDRLAVLSPRAAKVVELRFFGGLSVQESADVLTISARTVNDDWVTARAWLRREMSEDLK